MPKASKEGRRNSSKDSERLQQIHDLSVENGADCAGMTKSAAAAIIAAGLPALATKHKALKSLDYAMVESWDLQNAASAVSMLASIAANEAAQGEGDDVEEVGKIIKALLAFMGGELQEMMTAATAAPCLCANLPNCTCGCAACRAGNCAGCVDCSCPVCQPKEQPAMMSSAPRFNLTYIKSLHLPIEEQRFKDLLAVKAVGADTIRGYSMLWGDPALVDVEREFFTKSSDFWDGRLATPKPLTWDHGQDESLKAPTTIGQIEEFGDDEVGRWYVAQLDRAHRYRKAVDKLIAKRELGTSSDSAPQYVVREKSARGATWLKCWPWFASALTTTPAEPRMFGTLDYFKGLGIALPEGTGAEAAEAASAAPRALSERLALIQAHEAQLRRYL